MKNIIQAAVVAAIGVLMPLAAAAADLELKWISENGALLGARTLQLADLDELPQSTIVTGTPWTSGINSYSGPLLKALSELIDGEVYQANIYALNDYDVVVPSQDWKEYPLIIASRFDDRVPRIYEKGPYWLMYPVYDLPDPLPQRFLARMIWQISRIEFYVR